MFTCISGENHDLSGLGRPRVWGVSISRLGLSGFRTLPIVSIVVPFWDYLIGSQLYFGLNQKKGTTMDTIGMPRGCWV